MRMPGIAMGLLLYLLGNWALLPTVAQENGPLSRTQIKLPDSVGPQRTQHRHGYDATSKREPLHTLSCVTQSPGCVALHGGERVNGSLLPANHGG